MNVALKKFVNKKGGGKYLYGWWSNELYLNHKREKVAVWSDNKIFVLPQFAGEVRRAAGISVEVISEFKVKQSTKGLLNSKIEYIETPGEPASSLMPNKS